MEINRCRKKRTVVRFFTQKIFDTLKT